MTDRNRREFLADVGRGMLVASIGPVLASDLGLSSAFADQEPQTLSFARMEPLVALMQETPIAQLLPTLVERYRAGTELRTLVAAAALANARTFGGQDYDGYHAFMALAPAYQMARELPEALRPLPVLKVLYRNTHRIQDVGGRTHEVLHPVQPATLPAARSGADLLREATRRADGEGAERTFAALARKPTAEAFDDLQGIIQDEMNVHRVVLAWRAWALLDLTGPEQAHTLLRQSVRFCVAAEQSRFQRQRPEPEIRTVLPALLDRYHLLGRRLGERAAEDARVEWLSWTIYGSTGAHAADAVAEALAEGMAPEAIGEAISLAANRLVLCDPGRRVAEPGKPVGSVHGASVGVHASDAANAWRNIARVSNHRNRVASLIVGAYHTAGQASGQNPEPYPLPEHRATIRATAVPDLVRATEAAIQAGDQARASALVQRAGELGHPAHPVFDLLLRYAVSQDGALHAEKYYRTVSEEFVSTRPAFRWRHLVGLARVTASEYGRPAPGYADACRLLNVSEPST